MKLEETLRDGAATRHGTFDVDGPVVVSDSFSLAEAELRFTCPEACLTLRGPGPFRFEKTRFVHEGGQAPTLLVLEDAWASFAGCHFQGANGGTEEALACAVALLGSSEARFQDCGFEDNDVHIEAKDESALALSRCHLFQALADAVRIGGNARLNARDCELLESGWCGLVATQDAAVDVASTRLSGNGCHGLSAGDRSRLQTARNSFTGNRQHGMLLHGKASLLSNEDHLAANDLCGLADRNRAIAFLSRARRTVTRATVCSCAVRPAAC